MFMPFNRTYDNRIQTHYQQLQNRANDHQIGQTKEKYSLSIILDPIIADRRHIRNDVYVVSIYWRFTHDRDDLFFPEQQIVIDQTWWNYD